MKDNSLVQNVATFAVTSFSTLELLICHREVKSADAVLSYLLALGTSVEVLGHTYVHLLGSG